jgi:hypothetical protein
LINNNFEELKPRISVYPYLSGDAFIGIADACVLRNFSEPIILRNTKPKIVFLETGLLESLDRYPFFDDAKVIIIHNGDKFFNDHDLIFSKRNNLMVFSTNSSRKEGFLEPIPIGIENAHHCRNGSLHYYNPLHLAQLKLTKTNGILVSFSIETNSIERKRILDVCNSYGLVNELVSVNKFRKRLSESKFIISPPGNGIDCHRTWEAIYHKAIPVIEDKFNLFKHIDFPILSVPTINDFFDLTNKERDSIYNEIIEGKNYPSIYFDYWQQKIFSHIY